jgi:gentisate 1,2-dioxygenase
MPKPTNSAPPAKLAMLGFRHASARRIVELIINRVATAETAGRGARHAARRSSPSMTATLDELYAALAPLGMGAGWAKPTPSLYPVPHKTFEPAAWRYRDAHRALEAAGRLVDTALAERRNLVLINPLRDNDYGTAATLVAAYQMIGPGERARSHRHTPNALRLVLDAGSGTYTVVDGVRLDMAPGDVVLTPSWCWHGHANEGASAAYWLDFLDVPLVHRLEPMFFEPFPGDYEEIASVATDSPYLYRWSQTQARLAAAAPDPAGRFGRAVRLDRHPLATIGLSMHALDAGVRTAVLQTTANNIYSVVAGRGRSIVDGQMLDWERGDVFVAPAWRPHHHEPQTDAVLFRVSDEPLLAALGWLR